MAVEAIEHMMWTCSVQGHPPAAGDDIVGDARVEPRVGVVHMRGQCTHHAALLPTQHRCRVGDDVPHQSNTNLRGEGEGVRGGWAASECVCSDCESPT